MLLLIFKIPPSRGATNEELDAVVVLICTDLNCQRAYYESRKSVQQAKIALPTSIALQSLFSAFEQ
jgi:hypothetical protein